MRHGFASKITIHPRLPGSNSLDDNNGLSNILDQGAFILAQTKEVVGFPKVAGKVLAGRIEGRSSFARTGLLVHFTAPTICFLLRSKFHDLNALCAFREIHEPSIRADQLRTVDYRRCHNDRVGKFDVMLFAQLNRGVDEPRFLGCQIHAIYLSHEAYKEFGIFFGQLRKSQKFDLRNYRNTNPFRVSYYAAQLRMPAQHSHNRVGIQ